MKDVLLEMQPGLGGRGAHQRRPAFTRYVFFFASIALLMDVDIPFSQT